MTRTHLLSIDRDENQQLLERVLIEAAMPERYPEGASIHRCSAFIPVDDPAQAGA